MVSQSHDSTTQFAIQDASVKYALAGAAVDAEVQPPLPSHCHQGGLQFSIHDTELNELPENDLNRLQGQYNHYLQFSTIHLFHLGL